MRTFIIIWLIIYIGVWVWTIDKFYTEVWIAGIFISSYNDDIYKSMVFPKEERLRFPDFFNLE